MQWFGLAISVLIIAIAAYYWTSSEPMLVRTSDGDLIDVPWWWRSFPPYQYNYGGDVIYAGNLGPQYYGGGYYGRPRHYRGGHGGGGGHRGGGGGGRGHHR